MNAYCVSSMLSALHRWWHFILKTTLEGRGYYFSYLRELLYLSWENLSLVTDSRSMTNQGQSPNWNSEMCPKLMILNTVTVDGLHPIHNALCVLGPFKIRKIPWIIPTLPSSQACFKDKMRGLLFHAMNIYWVLWARHCLGFGSSKVSNLGFLHFGKLSSEYETALKNIKHYTNASFLWCSFLAWTMEGN